jgi:hypothetical protein
MEVEAVTEQTNGQQKTEAHEESAEALRVKAEHRQAIARIENEDRRAMAEMYRGMPVPLRIMFDPVMNQKVKDAALIMSEARGFTPAHLCGKTEACFAVVTKALTWGMDPWAVAASTFQTPDGKVGYEGKLIQAVIEGSGKLSKPIGQGQYFGDWSKIRGKFKIEKKPTKSGGVYDAAVPLWTFWGPEEEGLGIRYKVHLKGQDDPLEFEFLLKQAFPRNATTWPTRPDIQCHYAAMRALGNVVCPSLIMGVPSRDDMGDGGPLEMRDITPPAPPPVDLQAEGITGAGRMTEDDEEQQAGGGPKTATVDTAKPDEKPSWVVDGKTYLQPGRVEKILIGKVEACDSSGDLEQFEAGPVADTIANLPDENRQAVEEAIEHQRSVLEADRAERTEPEGDDGETQVHGGGFSLTSD